MKCCKELADAIDSRDIFKGADSFRMFGRPRLVNDGDGRFDDMTDIYTIRFCPFCGCALDTSGMPPAP